MTTSKAERFAHSMRRIPRRAIRCEIYGTTTAAVDKGHATNIIKKMIPTASSVDIFAALTILQNRLDEVLS